MVSITLKDGELTLSEMRAVLKTPLKVELESFVQCVEKKQAPVVTGESARQAIELALEITRQIQEQAD